MRPGSQQGAIASLSRNDREYFTFWFLLSCLICCIPHRKAETDSESRHASEICLNTTELMWRFSNRTVELRFFGGLSL